MRAHELIMEATRKRVIAHLDDTERYQLARYIYLWLSGNFMNGEGDWSQHMDRWKQIHAMFPPRFNRDPIPLYRLVTLPLDYAEQQEFFINPGHGPLTSWSKTLTGIDAVMGVARDSKEGQADTCRVAVRAMIPTSWIMATHTSMRDCFMSLTHDYFEKYPEVNTVTKEIGPDGKEINMHRTTHPGWPGGETEIEALERDRFHMYDVAFLRDVMNRPGGHCRQYEAVVHTPSKMKVQMVRVYRLGDKVLRYGNDDPHN